MKVLAFDLSLTATGVAWPDGELTTIWPDALPEKASHADQRRRIDQVRRNIISNVETAQPDLVAIEGFSFASKGSSVDQIYGLGWAVRLLLLDHGIQYVVIPPSNVKIYATGSGQATKSDMRMALFKRAGIDEADDNRVDAWWLRAMALEFYDVGVAAVPQAHLRGLDKVDWPTLDRSAA